MLYFSATVMNKEVFDLGDFRVLTRPITMRSQNNYNVVDVLNIVVVVLVFVVVHIGFGYGLKHLIGTP